MNVGIRRANKKKMNDPTLGINAELGTVKYFRYLLNKSLFCEESKKVV